MKSIRFWIGILAGVILSALVGFVLLPNLGVFPVSATGEPNILDWWGHTNLENFLERQAPERTIPAGAEPVRGFDHYLAMCLHCHGGPEAKRQEWANHMLPKPPELWEEEVREHMTDGELYYIIKNGIRMTGMPAFGPNHDDEDIWNMVAFIRRLDRLTQEQNHAMRHAASKFEHGDNHGHAGNNEDNHLSGEEKGH